METLLEVNKLYGGYGQKDVIKDVSFDIREGDFVGIIGPNGSGKSTLLRLMSRVLLPQRGSVEFERKDITSMNLKELFQRVAFVPQDTFINFAFTAWEVVLMGRIPHLGRLSFETRRDISVAEKALRLTDTSSFKDKYINELSAGERQRLIMAKALTQEPSLLLLDEPTSHLDIGHQIQILDLLKRLNQKDRMTIIIVLHDLNLASEYCQRILLLDEGKIACDGSPADVLTYQNIERIYKTVVVINKNPLTGKPYIILVSKDRCQHT